MHHIFLTDIDAYDCMHLHSLDCKLVIETDNLTAQRTPHSRRIEIKERQLVVQCIGKISGPS